MGNAIPQLRLLSTASSFAFAIAICSASSAFAQSAAPGPASAPSAQQTTDQAGSPTEEASPPDARGAQDEQVITVTASRAGRQGYSAPTPTTIVGGEQLEQRATTNIANYLNELPSFRPTTQPATAGTNTRSTGSNYLDLRGLGTSRTLVLVDGRRFVPEMGPGLPGYQVNINQIPALLVNRIEVVTGGASAQWGSDAVAGVVNVLLQRDFEGIRAEAQVGRSTHDDYGSTRFGLLAGTNFAADRGNVIAAVDYEQNFGVGDTPQSRDWGSQNYFLVANPCPNQVAVSAACPTGGNGQASNLILPDVQYSTQSSGGLITNTALRGTTFGPGGVSRPFVYGQYVGSTYMAGGEQPGVNFQRNQPISAPFRRLSTYGRASYKLTDMITASAEISYAVTNGGGIGVPYSGNVTIRNDNAFLPADIRTRMQQLAITSFALGKYSDDFITRGTLRNQTTRGVLAIDGQIPGSGNWRWSASVARGVNETRQRVRDSVIVARYTFAADAVVSNGQIVCRATIPGASFNAAAAGCVPMNLFGPGSSASAHDYVYGTVAADIDYRQTFASADISGEPFSTWAGPVSVIAGVEYRAESEEAVADPIANANGFQGNNSGSFSGSFNVKEGFAEAVVPLLRDSALGDSLELNGALRYADYSTLSEGQLTWKVGVTYRPFEGLLLRAARSRDIRAPNIFERQSIGSSRGFQIRYGSLQPLVFSDVSGNPALLPERATTTTIGFAFQPTFIPGLAFSLDHFAIDTEDLISTLSSQNIADLCLAGQQTYCDLITFNSAGVPTNIATPYLNLARVYISGFDAQANYRLPLSRLGAGLTGTLQFGLAGTYTTHAKVTSGAPGVPTIDRAGETGPKNEFSTPRVRFTSSINYSNGPFSIYAQARHISSGKYDVTFTPLLINDNHIPGRTYFDLSGTYEVTPGVTFFANVNNVFDRDPPPDPTANTSPTNAIYFDTIGRTIRIGLRFTR